MTRGIKKVTDIWAMSVSRETWCHLTRPATSLPRHQGNKKQGTVTA